MLQIYSSSVAFSNRCSKLIESAMVTATLIHVTVVLLELAILSLDLYIHPHLAPFSIYNRGQANYKAEAPFSIIGDRLRRRQLERQACIK